MRTIVCAFVIASASMLIANCGSPTKRAENAPPAASAGTSPIASELATSMASSTPSASGSSFDASAPKVQTKVEYEPPKIPRAKSFQAWSDQNGVKWLAEDCHAESDVELHDDIDPLACKTLFEQSCQYDPCVNDANMQCRKTCMSSCDSCDQKCGGTCDACKAKCKPDDDACKLACAKTTATCKDRCMKSFDHCATGDCAAQEKRCEDAAKAVWKSHHCSCKTISPCTDGCIGASQEWQTRCKSDDQQRADLCFTKMAHACWDECHQKFPGCVVEYCVQGGGFED